jgi:hypothetical protein
MIPSLSITIASLASALHYVYQSAEPLFSANPDLRCAYRHYKSFANAINPVAFKAGKGRKKQDYSTEAS